MDRPEKSDKCAIIKDGWLIENSEYADGFALTMKMDEIYCHEKTKFQEILIFQNETFGRVLMLDGTIQVTEKDEINYHECIAHIPLFSHPNPKSVLVVGGGDGGVLREVAKHSTVEEIHICEIDEKVIELSKKFLPFTAIGFSSPKVKVHIQDGVKYLADCKGKFDVIITDSSDSTGLASFLFEKPFHQLLKEALKPRGIICTQADDAVWIPDGPNDDSCLPKLYGVCKSLFPVIALATASIPSFPCGEAPFMLASTDENTVFEKPLRTITEKEADEMNLQYYDSEVHSAAFVLPRYGKKLFQSVSAEN